ncbi:GNAT family N-acetyltransferase [Lelliottia amnigena]|uniref:GNAT family N-acetyltransferase n=1 Tax=Lelliottia amnigena TaxID=61646 RepID=UPI001F1F0A0C|nr:GNAT family N-acetyltransferase [Lelliottia amnigena]UJD94203.1 GNAT family N-acetyltransferase [Lelliottia amnigena]
MSLKHLISGWTPCSFDDYAETYQKFGGSINMHPDIVEFLMRKGQKGFSFWQQRNKDGVCGAYFVTENNEIGLNVWREYPVSFDEVMLPVSAEQKIWLPDRTNRLSSRHRDNIRNSSFFYRAKRSICHVKDAFSAKTMKKRNGELRKFIGLGGHCYRLSDMSPKEIARLYVLLFKLRFADSVRCYEESKIEELFSALPHLIFGNVLFFDDTPCAIDLVLRASSNSIEYFDVPNGGVDPKFSEYSPGSILMWANIKDARDLCTLQQKEMVFSIGMYEKNWDYKLRWADTAKTGKVITL